MASRRAKSVIITMTAVTLLTLVACKGGGGGGGGGAGKAAVRAIKRYVSVARNGDEFARIFERSPTAGQEATISKTFAKAETTGRTALRASVANESVAQEFLREYRSTPRDGLITLVGHNAGGTFRFADGSTIDLGKLGSSDGSLVAVVSCESARFVDGRAVGIPTDVTYDVAYRTEQKFSEQVAGSPSLSRSEAQQYLESALADAVRELRVEGFYKTAVIGGGTGVVGVSIYQYV